MPVLPRVFINNIIKVFNWADPKKQISVRPTGRRPQQERGIPLQIMTFAAVTSNQRQEQEVESQDGTSRSRRSQGLCLHFLLLRWTFTVLLHHCVHATLAQGGNCREQMQTSVENCQKRSPFNSLT